jgi:hypothetical protein
LSGAVGSRTVYIRPSEEPAIYDHLPLGARLLLDHRTQDTTVRFDGAQGHSDEVAFEALGNCGRLTLNEVEKLIIGASIHGRVLVDADAARTITIDIRRPLANDAQGPFTLDVSDATMRHLERLDASSSKGAVRFNGEEVRPLTVTTGNGSDTVRLSGHQGNRITTGEGADDVVTGSGDDIIDLGEGDDRVDAGRGLNEITTGPGRDTVIISTALSSSLSDESSGWTTVTDFDALGGDKLSFGFAASAHVADGDMLTAIQRRIDALDPAASLRDALMAARELTDRDCVGWFARSGATYAFVDHPDDPLVELRCRDLSASNFIWGE